MSQLHDRARVRAGQEAGFSLPELLISVVLTAVVVTTLATAMAVILRNVDSASNREDRARSTNTAANWFAADAASARGGDVSTTSLVTCGPTDAVGVVSFSWNDYNAGGVGGTTLKTANWVVKGDELIRRTCVKDLATSQQVFQGELVVARDLPPGERAEAELTADLPSGSTVVNLEVPQQPTEVRSSAATTSFTLSGTTRPGGAAPNKLTPPNLLLLSPTGTALQVNLSTLNVFTTAGGSNVQSTGYVNSTSNSAVSGFLGSVNSTIRSPGDCGGSFFFNCPDMESAEAVPDPLANLQSPLANTEWRSSLDLPTFDCTTSSNQLRGNAQYCGDRGPGIYEDTLWLRSSAELGGACTLDACPYILKKGLVIGDTSGSLAPTITSRRGVLIDLEGPAPCPVGTDSSMCAIGDWNAPGSLSFDAAVGGPYSGISIFQPRSNTTSLNLLFNGTLRTNGLVYAPAATVQATGQWSGNAILNSLIANRLDLLVSFTLQIGGLDRPGPTMTGVVPAHGGQGALRRSVTINGTNLQSGATVRFGGGPAATGVSAPTGTIAGGGGTTLTFDVDIAADAPVGVVDVTVINPDGTEATRTGAFRVLPSPTITSVTPSSRAAGSTAQVVTVTGSGFLRPADYAPGTGVVFSNPGVTTTSVNVVSGSVLTAVVNVAETAAPGPVDVTVSNMAASGSPDVTAPGAFNVSARPTVTAIAVDTPTGPAEVVQGRQDVPVTVTGTGFQPSATVSFGGPNSGITVDSVTVVDGTTLRAVVDVAVNAPTGGLTVGVSNNDGGAAGSKANALTVLGAPKVTGVSPAGGGVDGGTTVTITGTDLDGVTGVTFGEVPAAGFTGVNRTSVTAVAPAQGAGVVDVRVTTARGTSPVDRPGNLYAYGGPTVTGVTPRSGAGAGGTTVTVTGTGFTAGSTVAFGTTAGTAVTWVSPTTLTARAPAGTGTVDVRVTNPSGTSPVNRPADLFTYGPATLTAISPAAGPITGGTSVTITGTGFLSASGVSFGATAATSFTVASDTSITAVAPAATTAAVVDVTVTNPGGTSTGGSASKFTYYGLPAVTGVAPVAGPASGGTTVTITGTNMLGTTGVRFGNVAATSFTVNGNTSVTAVAPAQAAGVVGIRVTNPVGTSADTAGDDFTYDGVPTVTGISVGSSRVDLQACKLEYSIVSPK